jgi:hypothetical protein
MVAGERSSLAAVVVAVASNWRVVSPTVRLAGYWLAMGLSSEQAAVVAR